jgi:hypothetical protein
MYFHCHILLYLKAIFKNSCNKITFTAILFHFVLQQPILENIIKAELKGNIFITY